MTQKLHDTLLRRARAWAGQMTRLAKSFAPNHVKSAISSHVEERSKGEFIIRTVADRRLAPDARAQEYGSGLHARRGPKVKYPIRPKTRKMLAFYWEVADRNPEQFVFAPDGRVLLPSVNHPGIEAANEGAGYIRPAAKELRRRGKAELKEDIRAAILSDLRTSFGRKA